MSGSVKLAGALPPLEELLLSSPLYAPLATSALDKRLLRELRGATSVQFDAHCVHCNKSSTFRHTPRSIVSDSPVNQDWMFTDGQFTLRVHCARDGDHTYTFSFSMKSKSLTKWGQIPSIEDIAGHEIEKYRPLLKGSSFSELRKATGLASHGIGIGSFVYLRRIFERLIYQYADVARKAGEPLEGFESLKMEDKIRALKVHLPVAVVKHRSAYSILSKGLHELTEDECKLYFPAVRSAIIRMLEEDWQARDKRKAEVELENELRRISSAVSAPPSAPKEDEL